MNRAKLAAVHVIGAALIASSAIGAEPLQLVTKIPLGAVSGRIDHMSIDRARHRLFVAELGNGTVSAVDLEAKAVLKRLTGLSEPQGVLYVPGADRLIVANGGNGIVQSFSGENFSRQVVST